MSIENIFNLKISEHNFTQLFKSAKHPREQNRFLAFSHLEEAKSVQEVAEIERFKRNTIYVMYG